MECGHSTIPQTIDRLATERPDEVWARYPQSTVAFENGELQAVTFAQLAHAIDRLAWSLDIHFGDRSQLTNFCYIGPTDLRYFVVACAASKSGRKAVFSSPRNSIPAHLSLLEKTDCQLLLSGYAHGQDSVLSTITNNTALPTGTIPSLDELFAPAPTKPYHEDKRCFADLAPETFVVLQTSGSTGLPKPVHIVHGLLATIDAQKLLPDIDGRRVSAHEWANCRIYTALPPFHSAGINFFAYSIFQGSQLVLGPADKPPSVDTVDRILSHRLADAGIIPPSLLSEVARDEHVLPKLAQWSSVTFGGGPLPQREGNAIWRYTHVLQILGSTETFNLPELVPRRMDEWQHHNYHPALGIEFRHHSENLHELVFVRDEANIRHLGAFWTFPDLKEYSMKDLYERHPTEAGLWKYRGRADDIVVLSNGEKFNPTDAEQVIAQHPDVRSALIVGSSREQAALLVEPADTEPWDGQGRRQSIVEIVAKANDSLPAHAQIQTSHVQVLDSSSAFQRSAKGEVQRMPTTEALGDVVERLYLEADSGGREANFLDFSSEQDLFISFQEVVATEYLPNAARLPADKDLFSCGFDSLRALQLARLIKSSLKSQGLPTADVSAKMVYQHNTLGKLSMHVMRLVKAGTPDSISDADKALARMDQLLEEYKSRIDELSQMCKKVSQISCSTVALSCNTSNTAGTGREGRTVVLTGSTGSLGSYILDALMQDDSVQSIICLSRPGSDATRQAKINASRGLSQVFSKVEFLETDLTSERLGLDDDTYGLLLQRAAHIIHNAWPVNFNLSLESFEPQLEGCFRLLELAHSAKHRVTTTFLSSVGAANNWSNIYSDAEVPETLLEDYTVAEPMGYAQSKYLAERIFHHASRRLGLAMNVCRIGQIAGPVLSDQGSWNQDEWFPSLIRSAKVLGKLPSDLAAMDRLDWTPVDVLGTMLARFAVAQSKERSGPGARFLHILNPNVANWRDLAPAVCRRIGGDIELVSYADWLQSLKCASEEAKADVADLPAAKLIDFFGEIGKEGARRPVFSTRQTEDVVPELRGLDPVCEEWMGRWIGQWGGVAKE